MDISFIVSPPFVLSIILNICTLTYILGVFSTRLSRAEADITNINVHVDKLIDLHAEMATIQTELRSVNQTLLRFEKYFMDGGPN